MCVSCFPCHAKPSCFMCSLTECRVLLGLRIPGVLVLLAMVARAALAQTTGPGATLVGVVTDTTGAVVPSAKVVVRNTDTSFRSDTTTDSQGSYYVPYLIPGSYQITVEAAGFKSYLRDGIVLRSGETPRVDIQLEVGSVSEQMKVTAAAPLLVTETAVISQAIDRASLATLPMASRRVMKDLYYLPDVTSTQGYHPAGGRTRAMGYTVDGMDAKTPGVGSSSDTDGVIMTSQDAVEEVRVTTNGVGADIGHAAAGVMALVYRSGTNELHGSFDSEILRADTTHRNYFEVAQNKFPFHDYEIDGTASGPVILPKLYNGRNRTFWVFGLAILEDQSVYSIQTSVPTAAMLHGDFSLGGIGLPIYNPFTTQQNSAGNWTRDPFPGNQIPQSLFDPAVQKFLAHNPWTAPTGPGVATKTGPQLNLVGDEFKHIRRTRWDTKIDHQFTSNHKIFGRYSQGRHRADVTQTQLELANWPALDYSRQPAPTDQLNFILSDNLILGAHRFNEARLGYNWRSYKLGALTYNQDWAGQLGIPNVSPLTFPYFSNIGYDMHALSASQQIGAETTFQDNFTQILGRHTVKTGFELIKTAENVGGSQLPSGSYAFGGTELPFTPNTGNTFASFLLGTVTQATFTKQFATWLPRWWSYAGYIQDDWKAVPSLTLNLGLRWSYETPFQTKYGQQTDFDPTAVDPLTGLMGAITHPKGPLAKSQWKNFQPRLGLAWSFRPKWVFRSSFGIIAQDLMANDLSQNFQEYVGTVNVQQPSGDPRYAFLLSQGPPPFSYGVQSNGAVPYVGTNYSLRNVDWFDPNMKTPYVMNWSAGFQRQLTAKLLAEVSYQGKAGVHLLNSWNINAIPLNISTNPTVLKQIYQSVQNYLPYPQFGNVNLYSNFGHSTYHAATVRMEERFHSGLTLLSFYTFAKTLDNADDDGAATGITYYNRSLEKGRAGYDITHHWVIVLSYEFPFGKGRRWLQQGIGNHLLGGWTFAANQLFESGAPFTVTFAGSPNQYLPGASRPNVLVSPQTNAQVPNWSIGPNRFPASAQNPYLIPSDFAYPAPFTAGTLGRNIFEAPGMNWTQLSLSRTWAFRERAKLTLRTIVNNLPFKQPNFAAPNAVYNANSLSLLGTFTNTQGSYTAPGSSKPTIVAVIRAEF